MRILLTNDDGIGAQGLQTLRRELRKIEGVTLDVIAPKEKANGAGVIWVISGGWFSAHDSINPDAVAELLKRGYTVFAVVHGSQPKYTIPEVLEDMHRSVRFIHHNGAKYGVDPQRLGITGGSAGGHLSLMIGMAGKRISQQRRQRGRCLTGDPNRAVAHQNLPYTLVERHALIVVNRTGVIIGEALLVVASIQAGRFGIRRLQIVKHSRFDWLEFGKLRGFLLGEPDCRFRFEGGGILLFLVRATVRQKIETAQQSDQAAAARHHGGLGKITR